MFNNNNKKKKQFLYIFYDFQFRLVDAVVALAVLLCKCNSRGTTIYFASFICEHHGLSHLSLQHLI